MLITVEGDDWGGALRPDIQPLLENVQAQLLRHFHEPPGGRIIVQFHPQEAAPRVLFRNDPDDDYVIWLTARGNYWAKYAYQFSHELCHILSDFERLRRSANQWFHEVLCELSSIFVLKQMSEAWRNEPPYPNWADYSSALGAYANEVVNRDVHRLPTGVDMRSWLRVNEPSLRSDPYQRSLNGLVAVRLLPLFQSKPAHWECVRHLPHSDVAISEYLVEWEALCPEPHKPFVGALRFSLTQSPAV